LAWGYGKYTVYARSESEGQMSRMCHMSRRGSITDSSRSRSGLVAVAGYFSAAFD
jgi:hypothetical protein